MASLVGLLGALVGLGLGNYALGKALHQRRAYVVQLVIAFGAGAYFFLALLGPFVLADVWLDDGIMVLYGGVERPIDLRNLVEMGKVGGAIGVVLKIGHDVLGAVGRAIDHSP